MQIYTNSLTVFQLAIFKNLFKLLLSLWARILLFNLFLLAAIISCVFLMCLCVNRVIAWQGPTSRGQKTTVRVFSFLLRFLVMNSYHQTCMKSAFICSEFYLVVPRNSFHILLYRIQITIYAPAQCTYQKVLRLLQLTLDVRNHTTTENRN